MTNPPPTPPDPAQWTWVDQFTRTFLGPDYTSTGASLDGGALRFGPMRRSVQQFAGSAEQPALPFGVTVAQSVWTGPDIQVQFDWQYTWQSAAGESYLQPGFQLTALTSTSGQAGQRRVLRFVNGSLRYGTVQNGDGLNVIGGILNTGLAPNAWQRVRLTVDTVQGRIQVQAGDLGTDVALPGDFLAEFAGGAQLEVIAQQFQSQEAEPFITMRVDNLAIRAGDGTADLSTGTANVSGGIRLGGEWRFVAGAPDNGVGSDGDVWVNSTTGVIHRKQAGAYVYAMTLLGAPGPQGEQGIQGVQGAQGAPGALAGELPVPLSVADATPDGGLLIPVTAGGYAGFILAGVDGPAMTVEVSTGGPYTPATYPLALTAGMTLRLTRESDSGEVSTLRLRMPAGASITLGSVTGLQAILDDHGARLTALEQGGGGGGVDTEQVQDIVAAMLGTVGTYNDAAGTYTITLPQPRTDEEIQDVVAALIQAGANITKTYDDAGNVLTISTTGGGGGAVSSVAGRTGAVTLTTADLPDLTEVIQDTVAAMIQPGTNVTRTYDDAAGTLTINASGGGGSSGTPRLSAEVAAPVIVSRTPARNGSNVGAIASGLYIEVTPDTTVQLRALRDAVVHGGDVTARVWRVTGGSALLATSNTVDTTTQGAGTYDLMFGTPVTLTAGTTYRIGLECPTSGSVRAQAAGVVAWTGFTVGTAGIYYPPSRGTYPASNTSNYIPTFDLGLEPSGLAGKGVLGPLDPADFPVVTSVALIPNGGGARLSGTGDLYLRTSGGQLYKLAGTAVSG